MIETLNNATWQPGGRLPKQRGVVVPIVAIGLLALLAVAGLALDASHALANKARMQNTVDAAALAAAKVLDLTGDTDAARTAAENMFDDNALGAGNHELADACTGADCIDVEYSETVSPFTPGSPDGPFVRVIATGFDTQTTLSRVLGINEIPTPATAVAGPSGPLGTGKGAKICDVAPVAVCEGDVENADPNALRVLRPEPGVHHDIGPGNFKFLDLGDSLREAMAGSYQECLTLTVAEDGCEGEENEESCPWTKTGQDAGPVWQGFNTRFNEYGSNLNDVDHPPDKYVSEQYIDDDDDDPFSDPLWKKKKITRLQSCNDPLNISEEYIFLTFLNEKDSKEYCDDFDPHHPEYEESHYSKERVTTADQIPYDYDRYRGLDGGPDQVGGTGPVTTCGAGCEPLENRRVLVLPVIACNGTDHGKKQIPVTGTACFFMVQSLAEGMSHGSGNIFGQLLKNCVVKGTAGIDPGDGTGPLLYKIQLYKDPDSGDS